MEQLEQELANALGSLSEDRVVAAVTKLAEAGAGPLQIEEQLQKGMLAVEARYEEGEYFLGDLIVAGTLFIEALKLLPAFDDVRDDSAGKVVIGVVNEDIHDIGKDIVVQVLRSRGFNVLDLGVDVSPERYVDEVERFAPDVAALSGVMGNSPQEMKRVIELMEARNLREKTFVVIGGACASEKVCELIGADAYGEGPVDTANLCQEHVKGRRD